jgi:hypothetical protein
LKKIDDRILEKVDDRDERVKILGRGLEILLLEEFDWAITSCAPLRGPFNLMTRT